MILLYQIERHPDGAAKVAPPDGDKPGSPKQMFARRCYLNGVTDGAAVDRLWADEVARARAKDDERRKQRRVRKPRRGKRP